ncbi:hypothetical protein MMPV_008236 [Pyropia vietnamensis]
MAAAVAAIMVAVGIVMAAVVTIMVAVGIIMAAVAAATMVAVAAAIIMAAVAAATMVAVAAAIMPAVAIGSVAAVPPRWRWRRPSTAAVAAIMPAAVVPTTVAVAAATTVAVAAATTVAVAAATTVAVAAAIMPAAVASATTVAVAAATTVAVAAATTVAVAAATTVAVAAAIMPAVAAATTVAVAAAIMPAAAAATTVAVAAAIMPAAVVPTTVAVAVAGNTTVAVGSTTVAANTAAGGGHGGAGGEPGHGEAGGGHGGAGGEPGHGEAGGGHGGAGGEPGHGEAGGGHGGAGGEEEDLEVTPTADPACFPGSATVRTAARRVVRMDALRLGDEVIADAAGGMSPVYLFSHADAAAVSPFVRLTTVNGSVLTVSPGHYLLARRRTAGARRSSSDGLPASAGKWALVAASAVTTGDVLATAVGGGEAVMAITSVTSRGLYNPHTLAGTVVVDGFVTSTHTTAVEPGLAAAALAPLRGVYRLGGGAWLGNWVSMGWSRAGGGWPALTALLPSGPDVVA